MNTYLKRSSFLFTWTFLPFVGSLLAICLTPGWFNASHIVFFDWLCLVLLAANAVLFCKGYLPENHTNRLWAINYALFIFVLSQYHFNECQDLFVSRLSVLTGIHLYGLHEVLQNMIYMDRLQAVLLLLIIVAEYTIVRRVVREFYKRVPFSKA